MFDARLLPFEPMGSLSLIAIGVLLTGFVLRLRSARTYVDLHIRRYSRRPRWTWMWTPVDDPEIERLRRIAAAGSLLSIFGAILLVIDAFS